MVTIENSLAVFYAVLKEEALDKKFTPILLSLVMDEVVKRLDECKMKNITTKICRWCHKKIEIIPSEKEETIYVNCDECKAKGIHTIYYNPYAEKEGSGLSPDDPLGKGINSIDLRNDIDMLKEKLGFKPESLIILHCEVLDNEEKIEIKNGNGFYNNAYKGEELNK